MISYFTSIEIAVAESNDKLSTSKALDGLIRNDKLSYIGYNFGQVLCQYCNQ